MSLVQRLPQRGMKWMVAALVMIAEWCFSADEQQFGRLFTTPEQRQRLQELREEHRRTSGGRKGTGTETGEMTGRYHAEHSEAGMSHWPDEPPVITLKGLIYRNDGARTAWIKAQDGTVVLDSGQLQTGELPDHEATLRVPVSGKSVKLKPGQSWHPESGAVIDPSFLRRQESSKKTSRRDTL